MALQELSRALLPVVLATSQLRWFRAVNQTVPEPYLDEVFHVPQAQAFDQGQWSHWDDKITTPPGLYLYSLVVGYLQKLTSDDKTLTTGDLRLTNVWLSFVLLVTCTLWARLANKRASSDTILQREYCIIAFPLIFFFSALYYTDLFSAFTVIVTMIFWQASSASSSTATKLMFQLLHFVSGLVSLTARQTNIFWVAVYLGGMQVIETVKAETRIHDPPVADAYFEDYPTMTISLASSALNMLFRLIPQVWPQLSLLVSFAAFVAWNGGVVMGDKTNHVATIHLPQMLYLWPFLMFFSWPVVIPHLKNIKSLKDFPRLTTIIGTTFLFLGVIHFNTTVHKFLLADNRHYGFYVFKILRTYPWMWYAAAPVYVICAWLSIVALGSKKSFSGGVPKGTKRGGRRLSTSSGKGDMIVEEADTVRISFVLVWLLSTALSLVTAPLVEPRYFLVPWLIWRLNVPELVTNDNEGVDKTTSVQSTGDFVQQCITRFAYWSLRIEFLWYMAVNFVTARLFLERGFSWPSEPGKVQRFMW